MAERLRPGRKTASCLLKEHMNASRLAGLAKAPRPLSISAFNPAGHWHLGKGPAVVPAPVRFPGQCLHQHAVGTGFQHRDIFCQAAGSGKLELSEVSLPVAQDS